MAPIGLHDESLQNLAGKVVVVAGGPEGAAYSAVQRLHQNAAHVVLGDKEKFDRTTSRKQDGSAARIDVINIDVSSYSETVRLFRKAFEIHGRIDHAIFCPFIFGDQHFMKDITVENIDINPNLTPVETHLIGAINFARVAMAYLKHDNPEKEDKSLTFMTSILIFTGISYSPLFQAASSGMIQLFRALRPLPFNVTHAPVRINIVCADLTAFPCLDPFLVQATKSAGMHVNEIEEVAKVVCTVAAQQEVSGFTGRKQLHGTMVICTGDYYWEFEEEVEHNLRGSVGECAWQSLSGVGQMYKRLNVPVWGSYI